MIFTINLDTLELCETGIDCLDFVISKQLLIYINPKNKLCYKNLLSLYEVETNTKCERITSFADFIVVNSDSFKQKTKLFTSF